jgi:SAM-dependent methyltransferase
MLSNTFPKEFGDLITDDIERARYRTLLASLQPYQSLFRGKRVLDFGASYGLSMAAALNLGALEAVGVEPELARVERGVTILSSLRLDSRSKLIHLPDTNKLPFDNGAFDFVLVNAVFEHIPQPRDRYIAEVWRCVATGGYLFVNETPNKYFPIDLHTTGGLWWIPWLPKNLARRYAIWRGRWSEDRDWESSGWRGLGYLEIANVLKKYSLVPEMTRTRHRLLHSLGLPASLMDPYPVWIFQKLE